MTGWFRRHWVAALAAVALVSTVASASAVMVHNHRAAGLPLGWADALLWQGLIYASWVPVGWALVMLVRRMGLGARLVGVLYGLCLVVTALHAVYASALDIAFSPSTDNGDWVRLLAARAPVDMLIYLALATLAAALQAHRRAAEETARAAAMAEALEAARRALDAQAARPAEPAARLMVSVGPRRTPVDVGDVEWFGSAGNYVVVNWHGREGLMRDTLQAVEQRLDPAVFARSHRTTIVNLAKVRDAVSLSDGSWRLTMQSGAELVASRTYRDDLLRRLGRG